MMNDNSNDDVEDYSRTYTETIKSSEAISSSDILDREYKSDKEMRQLICIIPVKTEMGRILEDGETKMRKPLHCLEKQFTRLKLPFVFFSSIAEFIQFMRLFD